VGVVRWRFGGREAFIHRMMEIDRDPGSEMRAEAEAGLAGRTVGADVAFPSSPLEDLETDE
jgi:hypothetical protein